jgi:hypothetical protein
MLVKYLMREMFGILKLLNEDELIGHGLSIPTHMQTNCNCQQSINYLLTLSEKRLCHKLGGFRGKHSCGTKIFNTG